MVRSMENKLPRKLSDLLELAINDLEKVENSKEYSVDMGVWIKPHIGGRCMVCLAGSVMAMSLHVKVDPKDLDENYQATGFSPTCFTEFTAGDFAKYSNDDADALSALNDLRCGSIGAAGACMDIDMEDELVDKFDRDVSGYSDNPELFKFQMRELVKDLRTHGY